LTCCMDQHLKSTLQTNFAPLQATLKENSIQNVHRCRVWFLPFLWGLQLGRRENCYHKTARNFEAAFSWWIQFVQEPESLWCWMWECVYAQGIHVSLESKPLGIWLTCFGKE
jgi:hypothetical protein